MGGGDSSSGPRFVREESALVGLAAAARRGVAIPCLDVVERVLHEVACERDLRCKNGLPLPPASGGTKSDQREPVCTRAEIERALEAEVERTADAGVLPPRVALYALATLVFADHVPESFTKAHQRRQYRIVQSSGPPCIGPKGIATNMRCKCDEAELREIACRSHPKTDVASPYCAFQVDDTKSLIQGSIGTEPP